MIIRMGIRMLEGSFTFSSFGKESVQVCRCLTAVVCVCDVTQVARRAGGQPTVARWPSSRSRSGRWWRCTGVRRSARGGARGAAMMAVWTSPRPAFLSTPRSWDSKGDGKTHTVRSRSHSQTCFMCLTDHTQDRAHWPWRLPLLFDRYRNRQSSAYFITLSDSVKGNKRKMRKRGGEMLKMNVWLLFLALTVSVCLDLIWFFFFLKDFPFETLISQDKNEQRSV